MLFVFVEASVCSPCANCTYWPLLRPPKRRAFKAYGVADRRFIGTISPSGLQEEKGVQDAPVPPTFIEIHTVSWFPSIEEPNAVSEPSCTDKKPFWTFTPWVLLFR